MGQPVQWKRVLVEGIVIVGSILLAFGIDASWEGRQDRAMWERHVEALIRELRLTQDEMRVEISGVESSAEGSAAVLALMRTSNPRVTPEELAAEVLKSFNVGVFTAAHPVLTLMLSSGDLVEAESESLLPLLAQWQDRIEHLRLDSRHLERNREETIFDRSVTLGIPIEPLWPAPSLLGILGDGGMEAAFATREGRARRLAASYAGAEELAGEIVTALEQLLADSGR